MSTMQSFTEFRFQYADEAPRNVRLRADLRGRKWSSLRKLLISQSAPTEDPSPHLWQFIVDGEEIAAFDAATKTIGLDFGRETLVELRLRSAAVQPTRKRKEMEASSFDLGTKLLRILQENQSSFRSERESNGLAHRNVLGILGHISVHLQGIQTPVQVSDIVIDTDGSAQPLQWLQQARGVIALAPFFTPNHVSLLCKWGSNRIIHLDASHSLHPQNASLLSNTSNVSLTLVPYQLMDETNVDDNLAGGNCAMFTGLAAVACVLRYRVSAVRFGEFWSIFQKVLDTTPPQVAERIKRITLRNLLYLITEHSKDTRCDHLTHYPLPPPELSYELLRPIVPSSYDFTADFIFLHFFLDTGLGFHQVSLLGNVFRTTLQDMMERGFISFRLSSAQWTCQWCDTSQVAGMCSDCQAVYCSRECMQMGDECLFITPLSDALFCDD